MNRHINRDPNYRAQKSAQMSAQNMRNWSDPNLREWIIERMKETRSDPEYRARLSERVKQQYSDPDARALLSTRAKKLWADRDFSFRMVAMLQGRGLDLDYREKQSVAMRDAWGKRRMAYHTLRLLVPDADELFADCKHPVQRYALAYRLGKQLTPEELAVLLLNYDSPARDKENVE